MADANSAAELERLIERYNDAWNAQDLDTIVSFHAPGMVFENHTAGERAAGADVREHIGRIFANWPDLAFRGRRLSAMHLFRSRRRATYVQQCSALLATCDRSRRPSGHSG
mgnify:CR=1 FL=1